MGARGNPWQEAAPGAILKAMTLSSLLLALALPGAAGDLHRALGRIAAPLKTLAARLEARLEDEAEELDRVARERGAAHELIYLEGVGHTFDLQSWSKKPLPLNVRSLFLGFLAKHLGEP